MVSIAEMTQLVGNLLLYVMTIVLRNSLVGIQYMVANYPEASKVVFMLLALYALYKVAVRMIKMWVRTLVFICKFVLVTCMLLSLVGVYVRGLKFFTQDMPNVWHIFTNRDEYMKSSYELYDNINGVLDYIQLNDELRDLFMATKKNMDSVMENVEGFEQAKEYVNKFVDKDIQNSVKDFVQQGSAVAGQFVNYAQDQPNVRNFVNNFWN